MVFDVSSNNVLYVECDESMQKFSFCKNTLDAWTKYIVFFAEWGNFEQVWVELPEIFKKHFNALSMEKLPVKKLPVLAVFSYNELDELKALFLDKCLKLSNAGYEIIFSFESNHLVIKKFTTLEKLKIERDLRMCV